MNKTIILIPILMSTTLFTACSNRAVKADDNISKTQTVKETTLIGKLFVGVVTLYATNGNIEKALKATKFGGNASGYYVGEKLAIMQKKYKDKEERLIEEILQIDKESTELKEKTLELTKNLDSVQEEIANLEESKEYKSKEVKQVTLKRIAFKKKLEQKKHNLQLLLKQNEQISKKISFSTTKANEYKYEAEDKKEILKSISFLKESSLNYKNEILKEIASLNKTISTLE